MVSDSGKHEQGPVKTKAWKNESSQAVLTGEYCRPFAYRGFAIQIYMDCFQGFEAAPF